MGEEGRTDGTSDATVKHLTFALEPSAVITGCCNPVQERTINQASHLDREKETIGRKEKEDKPFIIGPTLDTKHWRGI